VIMYVDVAFSFSSMLFQLQWKNGNGGMEVVLLCGMHMCAGDAVIMLCRCLCIWKPVCLWLESRCSCWVNGAVLHCWD
jgi:hypothetical protein